MGRAARRVARARSRTRASGDDPEAPGRPRRHAPRLRRGRSVLARGRGGAVPRRPRLRRAGRRVGRRGGAARRPSTVAWSRSCTPARSSSSPDVCRDAGEAIGALRGLRRAVLATGAGLLGAGTHPSARRGRGRHHRQGALRAHPRPARRRGRRRRRRHPRPRGHAGRRRRHPRLQRPAPPPAAAAGAGRQLPLPPRARHRAGLRPRGDHARLAAHRRPARDARLRGLLPLQRAAGARRRRAGLHVVLVEAAARTRAWARWRSARSTPSPRWTTCRRSSRWPTASRATRPPPTRPRSRRTRSSRRPRSGPPGGASRRGCPTPTARSARSPGCSRRRSSSWRARRPSWATGASWTRCGRLVEAGGGAGRQRAAHAIGGMPTLLRETVATTARV